MRPEILFPLYASPASLPGVGPKLEKTLKKLGIETVFDLLLHVPSNVLYRRFVSTLTQARPEDVITCKVKILEHLPPESRQGGKPYRVMCADPSSTVHLVFFHAYESYLKQNLPLGQERLISGKIDFFHGQAQITHPDFIGPATPENQAQWQGYEPQYPLTQGLGQKQLRKMIQAALQRMPVLQEWLDPKIRDSYGWVPWDQALQQCHHPKSEGDLCETHPSRQRLAYDELLANQVSLLLIRRNHHHQPGRSFRRSTNLRARVLAALPFRLTHDQEQALEEIDQDMQSSERMLRLMQGDVGSGKTIVAFLALLNVIEAGHQGALMAPTEILARQHYASLRPWAEAAGIQIALLTRQEKGKARQHIHEGLQSGTVNLLVGTHALIQENVHFKDLACVVIDEQHRFGVEQRLSLAGKGEKIDLLLMTATPIPRTLMLTAYGDLACSFLKEKPAGRQPIDTKVIPLTRLDEVIQSLSRALARGEKVYWVCPLIEESEAVDLAAAQDRFQDLKSHFPDQVGLVHGRLNAADKEAMMTAFKENRLKILVSTTVIEVGVDVKDATVMVIEHAERFGLAQLHQLRGRVGRGERPSVCLLLYQTPLSEAGHARLSILRETNDGFRLAEEDFRLRGGGEALGQQQSGLPQFKVADFWAHQDLLRQAHRDAQKILKEDPYLLTPRGQNLKTLLHLFGRDRAVKYLQAG